jgi:hypothetical protein
VILSDVDQHVFSMTHSPRAASRKQRRSDDEPAATTGAATVTTRRRWVALCGGAALAGLAGCADDTGGGGGGDEPAGEDDGGDGGDGSAGGDGGDADGGGASGDGDAFGDVVQFESSFRMEGYFEQENGPRNEMVGRIDGNDSYWRFETDGEVSEIYSVDGDSYFVSGDQCTLNAGAGPNQGFTADQFEEDRSAQAEVTPTGRDTIDGEDVLVYEITSGEDDVTYYISADTGYPVRVETTNGAFDFSSWGDVEPVGTPDMECQEFGE